MPNWTVVVRTHDMGGEPKRDFCQLISADTAEKAAERVGLTSFERNASVEVFKTELEREGRFQIERRTTVIQEVVGRE